MEFVVIAGIWLLSTSVGVLCGYCARMLCNTDERRYTAERLREAVERCKRGDDA